eukprot:s266_g6.t1
MVVVNCDAQFFPEMLSRGRPRSLWAFNPDVGIPDFRLSQCRLFTGVACTLRPLSPSSDLFSVAGEGRIPVAMRCPHFMALPFVLSAVASAMTQESEVCQPGASCTASLEMRPSRPPPTQLPLAEAPVGPGAWLSLLESLEFRSRLSAAAGLLQGLGRCESRTWNLLPLVVTMSACLAAGFDACDSAIAEASVLLQAHVEFEPLGFHEEHGLTRSRPGTEANHTASLLEMAGLVAIRLQQRIGLCEDSTLALESQGSLTKSCLCVPTWALITGISFVAIAAFYLELSEHGNLLGGLVESFVEKFDQSFLGVETDFGAVKVIVHEGVIEVHDLTIYNPPGYWSDYFLHIGRTLVDIDMATYIASFGKHVVIEKVQLQDVDVIWEAWTHKIRDSGVTTTLRNVEVEDITLKFASYLLAGCGPRAMAPDIHFDNFEDPMTPLYEAMEASATTSSVIPMLILTLVESVLASLLGRQATQAILSATSGLARLATDAICHLAALLAYCFENVFCRCCRGREPSAIRERKSSAKLEDKRGQSEAAARRRQLFGCFSGCLPGQSLLHSGR